MWGATSGKRLEKTRYNIPCGGLTIELDIYGGDLEGYTSVEVEFHNQDERDKFTPPEWFGREITDDLQYKNQSLAVYGLPLASDFTDESVINQPPEVLNIPRYERDHGIDELIKSTEDKVRESTGGPVVIEIAGGSASDKTSAVAAELKKTLWR
jgi:hypothetical protein